MTTCADELDLLVDAASRSLGRLQGQVWVKSAEYRFSYVNPRFAQSMGCDSRDAIGATERPFFSSRAVAEFRATDEHAMASDRPIVVKEIGDSGQVFETLKVPLRSASAARLGTLGVAWNVTRWREIEDLVAAANERFPRSSSPSDGPRQSPTTIPAWLAHAISKLTEDPTARLTGLCLAHQLGFHPDSLGRAFTRCFGAKLGQYRAWLRAAAARDGILCSNANLAAIALDAGYADQSHMTREVERFFGLTPAALRRLRVADGWLRRSAV